MREPPPAAGASASPSAVGWGFNGKGELGAGFKSPRLLVPVSVVGVPTIKEVVATGGWSAALLSNGTVETWGGNSEGQLGDGTRETKVNPLLVKGLSDVTQIAGAGEHVIALLGNGTVKTWGANPYGQLGNGTSSNGKECCGSSIPITVPGLSGVASVYAGGADAAALLSNGAVYAWGENRTGQLGDGTNVAKFSPVQVRGLAGPVKTLAIGGGSTLGGHMLVLLKNGTVQAVGANTSGQLGNGSAINSATPVTVTGLTGVTQVAATWPHSLALLSDGTVRAWGDDSHGELGVPTGHCGKKPLPCSTLPLAVPGLSNVTAIAAGGYAFNLAISGGRVYAWGHNNYGQLGDGTTIGRMTPGLVSGLTGATAVVAGETHSLAMLGGSGPASSLAVLDGSRSVSLSWTSPVQDDPWFISYRPVLSPPVRFSPKVKLPPSARNYTVPGLEVRPYEISIYNQLYGHRVVMSTPLPEVTPAQEAPRG